ERRPRRFGVAPLRAGPRRTGHVGDDAPRRPLRLRVRRHPPRRRRSRHRPPRVLRAGQVERGRPPPRRRARARGAPSMRSPVLVLAALLAVAACGGGAGDDAAPATATASTPATA